MMGHVLSALQVSKATVKNTTYEQSSLQHYGRIMY